MAASYYDAEEEGASRDCPLQANKSCFTCNPWGGGEGGESVEAGLEKS